MSESLLTLKVDAKIFGERRIIDDVSLDIKRGEIVSLVGPSGCGKTTLLRIAAGLDKSYFGHVQLHNQHAQSHSNETGFIFQEPRLLPWLTVAENVGFSLGKEGGKHPLVNELLAEVGLADFGNAYPKHLSGGMAQRAAIARGLFTRPSLLFLDEPFSAVDAFTRIHLQELLITVAENHAITLMFVTHDISEAVYLSDRVIVLSCNPGRVRGEVIINTPQRSRDRHSLYLREYESHVLSLLKNPNARSQIEDASMAF